MEMEQKFCKLIFDCSYAPISRISAGGDILFQFSPFPSGADPVRGNPSLLKKIAQSLGRKREVPRIEVTKEYLIFGAVACRSPSDGFYLVGPIPYLFFFFDDTIPVLAEQYHIADKEGFFHTVKYQLPRMTGKQLAGICNIIQNNETGSFSYEETLQSVAVEESEDYAVMRILAKNRIDNPASDIWTLPYTASKHLMQFITSGDSDAALKYMNDNRITLEHYLPQLIQKIPFEWEVDEKAEAIHYGAIILASFASHITHEVINQGFHEETAWFLWWYYMEKALEAKSVEELNHCFVAMVADYSERATTADKGKEYLTKQSIAYIRQHICDDVTPTEVAELLGVSGKFLNSIFKKDMGVSLHQFIQQERIKAAKTLLAYGNDSILDISMSLHYNSQSYFTSVFKKATGFTPQVYREQFRNQ